MTNEYDNEIVSQIRKIVEEHPKLYAVILKSKKNRHLYEYVLESTKEFDELRFNERLYWLFADLHEYPKCIVCKEKDISHHAPCKPLEGYLTHTCSQSCAQKNPEYRARLLQKNKEKFGVDYKQQTDEYRNNQSKKLRVMPKEHWETARKKREQTCLKEYGVKNVMQVEENKDKVRETWSNFSDEKLNDITTRRKKSKKLKYNDENFSNPEKALKTREEKYGAFESQESKQKRKSTNLKNFGVECVMEDSKICSKAINVRMQNQRTTFYNEVILKNEFVIPLFTLDDYVNNANGTLKWKCKKCNSVFECKKYEHQSHLARCLNCYPLLSGQSNTENQIAQFIRSITDFDIVIGSRKIIPPQELDIFIPAKKIAIEYDGLYWHSIDNKGQKDYHANKTNNCEKHGIQLIHVFENEWIFKQDIVKSQLKSLFAIYDQHIDCNECKIVELDNMTAGIFLENNNIDGKTMSSANIGLLHNNDLVSLMSFRKCRFDETHEWEITRFCNKLNADIIGAEKMLLRYFENKYKPTSIIQYIDRRWNTMSACSKTGLSYVRTTAPKYWYWRYKCANLQLEAGSKYSKPNLKNLLEKYNDDLTEYQNMANNGYLRIFDSGYLVLEKKNTH